MDIGAIRPRVWSSLMLLMFVLTLADVCIVLVINILSYAVALLGDRTGSINWVQLRRFHLKMERELSL